MSDTGDAFNPEVNQAAAESEAATEAPTSAEEARPETTVEAEGPPSVDDRIAEPEP